MRVLTALQYLQSKIGGHTELDIVTHDGIFHADEVFTIALIDLLKKGDTPTTVVRTRDKDILASALDNPNVFVVDVGGQHNPPLNNYDHHQDASLNSALGLVVDSAKFTQAIVGKYGIADDMLLRMEFGNRFIQFVQSIDDWDCNRNNAHSTAAALPAGWRNVSQIIAGFNRIEDGDEAQNQAFETAVSFAAAILENEFIAAKKSAIAEVEYMNRYVLENGVALFETFSPVWKAKADHNFAVMPHHSGWQVLARDTAVCTIPETANGYEGFIFRHAAGFIATFNTREAAINFAKTL